MLSQSSLLPPPGERHPFSGLGFQNQLVLLCNLNFWLQLPVDVSTLCFAVAFTNNKDIVGMNHTQAGDSSPCPPPLLSLFSSDLKPPLPPTPLSLCYGGVGRRRSHTFWMHFYFTQAIMPSVTEPFFLPRPCQSKNCSISSPASCCKDRALLGSCNIFIPSKKICYPIYLPTSMSSNMPLLCTFPQPHPVLWIPKSHASQIPEQHGQSFLCLCLIRQFTDIP